MMVIAQPRVSIIIPVYNGADYMQHAIHSALSQTYPNIEVIVVNDGSKDEGKTDTIAKSYGDRIRYFKKENGGVSTALNTGIENMTGEYFSWLSHDDVYKPEKIEMQIKELEKYDDPTTILYGGYELINSNSEKFAEVNPSLLYPIEKLNLPLFALLRGLINGCSLLIHKSHFDRIGMFDPQLRSTQDYDLWFKMFRNSQVKFHSGMYVQSRSHPGQGTHTMSGHVEDCNKLWIGMIDDLTEIEMCEMEGSLYSFYNRTYHFLKESTPYDAAVKHVKKGLDDLERGLDIEVLQNKVSVVIPFYNGVQHLLEALSSALNQTHPNLEVLLIDDGSEEDVSKVLSECEKDNRIKYFKESHKGASSARNKGIDTASGDFIAFLDADDLFHPEKIQTQLKSMLKNGYEISHTSYEKINLDGTQIGVIESGVFNGKVFPSIISNCKIATPTVMIKKSIIKNVRFREGYEYGEDVCFWIDILHKNRLLGGIDKPLTKVRVSQDSAAYNSEKSRLGLINILSHVSRDREYAFYEAEIRQLLSDILFLFNAPKEPLDQPIYSNHLYRPASSRLKKLFYSLAVDGYKATFRKVLAKIKRKIN